MNSICNTINTLRGDIMLTPPGKLHESKKSVKNLRNKNMHVGNKKKSY